MIKDPSYENVADSRLLKCSSIIVRGQRVPVACMIMVNMRETVWNILKPFSLKKRATGRAAMIKMIHAKWRTRTVSERMFSILDGE